MHKKIVLLIDDDFDDAELFGDALSGLENIVLHCAEGGEQAMQMLSKMKIIPALILLDAGMPKMNGWECLRLLKENNRLKEIPVIMTATSSRRKGIDDARDLGAKAYIIKPSDFNELQNIVKVICSGLEDALEDALQSLQTGKPEAIFFFPQS